MRVSTPSAGLRRSIIMMTRRHAIQTHGGPVQPNMPEQPQVGQSVPSRQSRQPTVIPRGRRVSGRTQRTKMILKKRDIGRIMPPEAQDAGRTFPRAPETDTPLTEGHLQHHQGPTGRKGIRVPAGEGHRAHHGWHMKMDATWQRGIARQRTGAQHVVAGGQQKTPWEAVGATKMSGRGGEASGRG